jgi:hypothetical protein
MISRLLKRACGAAAAVLVILGSPSCVSVDTSMGSNLIPLSQLYDVYTIEFPLEDIQMKMLDSLSGYSNTRITIGAVRDEEFGLTTRACALSLVPVADTVNFGRNPVFKSFRFTAARDTVSYADASELNILQNINVYELEDPMDFSFVDLNTPVKHKTERITDGVPVYNGKDSLTFNFSRAFGEKYMNITTADLKDMEKYLEKYPGIYIDTDEPDGIGGRINMFNLQLGVNASYGYVTKDYAELKFTAEYNGVRKDSSFLFYFSPNDFVNLDSLVKAKSNSDYSDYYTFPQYCFNTTTHETREREGKATDRICIEGGGGLKAVFSASEMLSKLRAEISKHGDPGEAVVTRATMILPFEFPEDYKDMYRYPDYISPTCRMSFEEGVSFASLTDVSSTNEDPGKLNRSLLQYSPDITYHIQKLLQVSDDVKLSNFDIWTLLMSTEYFVSEYDSSAAMSEYLYQMQQMMYLSQLYGYGYSPYGYGGYGYGGYGYGGYGGYGYGDYGYGYGMSNYYSMALLASMYSNAGSGSNRKSRIDMDKDRYFDAVLNGPKAESGRVPTLRVIYALPKSAE